MRLTPLTEEERQEYLSNLILQEVFLESKYQEVFDRLVDTAEEVKLAHAELCAFKAKNKNNAGFIIPHYKVER